MAIVVTTNTSNNEDLTLDHERIAKLETQFVSIKENVSEMKDDIKELHSRITTGNREIVDKMDDMQTRIEHKMNANAEVAKKQMDDMQKSVSEDLQKAVKTLDADINKVSDRVDVLERWRWMIVGGAIVFGYILGHIEYFKDLLNIK